MGNRLKLTALLLIVFVTIGKAQTEFQKTDSISLSLYNSAEWQKLINFGKDAIAKGDDFPLLRLRVGYASFVRENFTDALTQYNKILETDRFNQIALYYAYLCNVYLNRPEDAGFLARRLEDKTVEGKKVNRFSLLSAGAETGIKFTNIYERGNSTYSRAFVDMRLGYRLTLSQSFTYFNQPIRDDDIEQPGYYVKLNYTPFQKINIIGAYHYMRSNLHQLVYQNNVGLLGLRYSDAGDDLQGDFILSQIGDEKTRQYNLKFTKYITGNLSLYTISRLTMMDVSGEQNLVFHQLVGFKPIRNLWFEEGVTFGNQYNYAEADGRYIYNGFDKTKFKVVSNCYFLLKQHILLGLNYTFERKSDNIFKFNYLQHSINGGITWNF